MTQKEQILKYLQDGKSFFQDQSIELFNCASPRKVVSRLREDGYDIVLDDTVGYYLVDGKSDAVTIGYDEFIKSKEFKIVNKSIEIERDQLNPNLFEYQKDLVYLALKKGKFALFAMTGTGKTAMELEWCKQVSYFTNMPTLILCPLSIAPQTKQESIDIFQKAISENNVNWYAVNLCESKEDVKNGINITNYEKLHKFDCSVFSGVALDESSILKGFTSSTTEILISEFEFTPYKLACTATPAPNDFMELGNHCQFLNVMQRHEMLATFFVHDGGETSKWRLKGHARDKFWEWVSNWAVLFTKPSDIGYPESEDEKYKTPGVIEFQHVVKSPAPDGSLFSLNAETLNERRQARRDTIQERCQAMAELVNNSDDIWVVWCDLNAENDLLNKLIIDSVSVKGSDSDSHKIKAVNDFKQNKIKCLITKPSMFGFGQNWQNCHNTGFTGLSDSFEQVFQAKKRFDRYGQKYVTNVHIVISEAEGNVLKNQQRKEKQFLTMIDELVVFSKAFTLKEIKNLDSEKNEYNPQIEMIKPNFIKVEE